MVCSTLALCPAPLLCLWVDCSEIQTHDVFGLLQQRLRDSVPGSRCVHTISQLGWQGWLGSMALNFMSILIRLLFFIFLHSKQTNAATLLSLFRSPYYWVLERLQCGYLFIREAETSPVIIVQFMDEDDPLRQRKKITTNFFDQVDE